MEYRAHNHLPRGNNKHGPVQSQAGFMPVPMALMSTPDPLRTMTRLCFTRPAQALKSFIPCWRQLFVFLLLLSSMNVVTRSRHHPKNRLTSGCSRPTWTRPAFLIDAGYLHVRSSAHVDALATSSSRGTHSMAIAGACSDWRSYRLSGALIRR